MCVLGGVRKGAFVRSGSSKCRMRGQGCHDIQTNCIIRIDGHVLFLTVLVVRSVEDMAGGGYKRSDHRG